MQWINHQDGYSIDSVCTKRAKSVTGQFDKNYSLKQKFWHLRVARLLGSIVYLTKAPLDLF
jgi:hypothetical protein